jgi:hypothetical protein
MRASWTDCYFEVLCGSSLSIHLGVPARELHVRTMRSRALTRQHLCQNISVLLDQIPQSTLQPVERHTQRRTGLGEELLHMRTEKRNGI